LQVGWLEAAHSSAARWQPGHRGCHSEPPVALQTALTSVGTTWSGSTRRCTGPPSWMASTRSIRDIDPSPIVPPCHHPGWSSRWVLPNEADVLRESRILPAQGRATLHWAPGTVATVRIRWNISSHPGRENPGQAPTQTARCSPVRVARSAQRSPTTVWSDRQ